MTEYTTTFSSVLSIPLTQGVSGEQSPVVPSGTGWSISDSFFIKDTSQIAWVWKKDEAAPAIYIDQLQADYETLSVDDGNGGFSANATEQVVLAVRPKAGGLIFPVSFASMQTDTKYITIRLYIGDAPSGGSWVDKGNYSQVNMSPDTTPPATKTQIGTVYIDISKRSDHIELDSPMFVTSTSRAIFITAQTVAQSATVLTSITWGEKSV